MTKVENNYEYEVTDPWEEVECDLTFRCYFSEKPPLAMYPMKVSGSIYKGQTLQEFIEESKRDYEKDYIKVELVETYLAL